MPMEFEYRIFLLEDVIHFFLAKHDRNVVEDLMQKEICLEDLEKRVEEIDSSLKSGYRWVRTEVIEEVKFAIFERSRLGSI